MASLPNHTAPQEPRFLMLFDFDETIIRDNSDDSAVCLLPSQELPAWLVNSYREGHYHEYSAKIMAYLADQGVTKECIKSGVENIPPNPGLLDLFRFLQSHQQDFELVVVSDANMYFIETWLEHAGFRHLFKRIFTNPSHFDTAGCLVLRPFHSHSCTRCPENMCKQAILREYLADREKERGGVGFQRVFYVGDGSNDVCPTHALGPQDTAFARRDYPMHRLLLEMQQSQSAKPKANVVPWVTGNDIVDCLEKIVRER
ncbi:PREDICTED: probable phosphatase phospho1 [Cyprinodon variegatus]|uniref:probable phosphatase phospho1 n=1 Tax=Cyprinodon variegatus TaxID=28743 RepID=UPI000742C54A|nr:PREDICTED: probable phosphatase phospho1 [Cyprinodon variegatus]